MKISITTKTGDMGESGLANGERTTKSDQVFEVIGTLDEVNSWLGLVAAKLGVSFEVHQQHLYQIQDTLFYIGAEVARSPKAKLEPHQVEQLETWETELQSELADNWHTQFVLPGGTELGGYLDVARTVCRRCERVTVGYAQQTPLSPIISQYLNRLSDYLYLLRCFVNQKAEYHEKKFAVKTAYVEKVKPKFE